MAASGFTPISLYYSTTASAVPTSGNLANGELGLNIADMKLYAKNSAGTVTLLASSGGAAGTVSSVAVSGGTTGLTTSGGPITTSGTITLAGTLATTNGGTGLTSFTSGGVVYASSTSALATGSGLVFDGTNLGLGVTPSAWGTANSERALQLTGGSLWSYSSFGLGLLNNAFFDSTGAYKYRNNGFATHYFLSSSNGAHSWQIAASGTAGNTVSFTQAMTLDANGNLGIGTSSPTTFSGFKTLELANSSGNAISLVTGTGVIAQTIASNTNSLVYMGSRSNHALLLTTNDTERMRIASSGDVGIGTNTPASKLDVAGIISDSNGNVRKVPQSGSSKTSSYTLATTDVGEYILLGASGAIVIPDATFAAGDVITIFNNTASTATITCSITTAYIAGTFTDKATMTLAAAGVATVLFITSTLCVVSGNVT